ncbi:MAG: hypothetical protein KA736_03415 [Crocinitomicaceae bacterium]|nr:hypothetical protein [Crocinitomicaceae bacterium]MBP6033628.1 hypothetical protein [Crocinitomicaceae bacterium]
MKTILSNLTERLSLLESGQLTQAEMELLVEDSKELYERLIILRYKLYETNVFVPQATVEAMFSETTSPMMEEVQTPAFDLFEMGEEEPIAIEEEIPTLHFEADEPEIPMVEASLFDMDIEVPAATVDLTPEEEQVEEPIQEEPEMEESADEFLATAESDHVEASEVVEEHMDEEVASVEIPEPEVSVEPQANFLDDITNPETTSINSAWILQIEQTIRSDRSVFPLETLIGSFSLNEKLQFINELFDGSSDAFSTATKKLDACQQMSEAREQLSDYSSTYNWDLESEIVEDFIFKICRRYATATS